MLTPTRLAGLSVLALAGLLLTACAGGSSGTSAPALTQAAAGTTASAAPSSGGNSGSAAGTVSDMSIRIANFYVTGTSQPGPALDLYDVQLQGQKATPILTDVAYGTFSAYAHPHLVPDAISKLAYFEVLPTGEDPVANKADASNLGALMDDGSHPQETLVLSDDVGGVRLPGPLASLASSTFLEKGDDGQGAKAPVAPDPPAGQGQLLASTAILTDERVPGAGGFLMIDDSCDEPLNHDPNSTGVPEIFAVSSATYTTAFALFPVTPATHQVSVAAYSGSNATCAQLTPKQGTVSIDVTAGQNIMAFVYGTSLTDLHVALGPIQP
jgi:hypothetical protein